MKIDMHIHTNNSDGQYTVEEIIVKAIINKINVISVTDHDNVKSCEKVERILLPKGFIYIPGVELSAIAASKYYCHILGYNIDYRSEYMQNQCEQIKINKLHRMLYDINYLKNNHKIEIPETEKKKLFEKDRPIGRTELCQVLAKLLNLSETEIFKKYLDDIPKKEEHRISLEDTINTIHKSKGYAIVAHPKEIEQNYNVCIEDIFKYFLERGIDGIEVYNSVHDLNDVKRYLQLAKKYNLLTTGGSDYHGENRKPKIELGKTTTNGIYISPRDINYLYKKEISQDKTKRKLIKI